MECRVDYFCKAQTGPLTVRSGRGSIVWELDSVEKLETGLPAAWIHYGQCWEGLWSVGWELDHVGELWTRSETAETHPS